jgi:hypothetical protein
MKSRHWLKVEGMFRDLERQGLGSGWFNEQTVKLACMCVRRD